MNFQLKQFLGLSDVLFSDHSKRKVNRVENANDLPIIFHRIMCYLRSSMNLSDNHLSLAFHPHRPRIICPTQSLYRVHSHAYTQRDINQERG